MNITVEQFQNYKDILNLESVIEMENLILKYGDALSEYYHNDIYDIEKLKLIVEAFLYFSDFETKENDCDSLINKGLNLLARKDENIKCYSQAELLYMIAMLISTKLLENAEQMDENQLIMICRPLYDLYATIESIDVYEKSGVEVQKTKSTN